MSRSKVGMLFAYGICIVLTVAAFFAKDFVLYDFHMTPSDYTIREGGERPEQASASLWFSYGAHRELQFGYADTANRDQVQFYGKTEEGVQAVAAPDLNPINEAMTGNLVAAAPAQAMDVDQDGEIETVYDFARADFGPHAYELAPRAFGIPEIPFELAFEERKVIQAFFRNQPLTGAELTVTAAGGEEYIYRTNGRGWIAGLPIKTIREGFTASYSPDGQTIYRMYYALEDYPYFTEHFFRAHIPLLIILLLSAAGIVILYLVRERLAKWRNPAHTIYSRERPGLGSSPLSGGLAGSKFLLIRWLLLLLGFFLWTYAGKVMGQGQALNQIAVPTFSCPFNLDQSLESSCYYLTHLPVLFTRNWGYITVFLATLFIFLIFFGRILCGFMCPLGLVHDLFDKLRKALHIRPITVSDRMNKAPQSVKWIWILLFLGFVFVGGDFCDICPNKVFSPALGGWWVNYALGGFLTVPLLVGSFYIKRFWCIICPMGYLLGLFHKFNLFKLKKDCTACTECGACYEACPMRLKNIYIERETPEVQMVDCLMCGECVRQCPENDALTLTFCGKPVYRSSKTAFLSKYAELDQYREEQEARERTEV